MLPEDWPQRMSHLFISPGPQNSYDVNGGNRWRQVCTDHLDVDEELPALHFLYERYPHDTDTRHEHHKQPGGQEKDNVNYLLYSYPRS